MEKISDHNNKDNLSAAIAGYSILVLFYTLNHINEIDYILLPGLAFCLVLISSVTFYVIDFNDFKSERISHKIFIMALVYCMMVGALVGTIFLLWVHSIVLGIVFSIASAIVSFLFGYLREGKYSRNQTTNSA